MAHGYLGDGYGIDGEFDPDRSNEQRSQRGQRNWREQAWRGSDEDRREPDRNRGTKFGFGERSRDYGPQSRVGGFEREYIEGRRDFSANPDDHYRSWRDRHMSELDRDYEDYCRERELQFHSDFDAWRRQRRPSVQPLRTGMTQSGLSADPTGQTQAETETSPATPEVQDPMANATLGTTSRGRSRG
jgi:hypothetical protein